MFKQWVSIFVLILVIWLTACGPQAGTSDPTSRPTATAIPPTSSFTLTPTPLNTATPTTTSTPTETPIPCFRLLEPADGTEFERPIGQVTFAWTEQFGAASYRFAITIPSGYVEEVETSDTGFERWLESFPLGGAYSWMVEALDSDGETICSAGPFTFAKEEYVEPTNTAMPTDVHNNNGEEAKPTDPPPPPQPTSDPE